MINRAENRNFIKLKKDTISIKAKNVNEFDLLNLGEETLGESKEWADLEEQSSESLRDVEHDVEGKGRVEEDRTVGREEGE